MSELLRIQQVHEAKLRSTRDERERIVLLNAYAAAVKQFDLAKAVQLAEEAYHLAVPLFDKKQMAESLKLIGECNYKIGNCSIAILKLYEAIELYTEFRD